jgi:hypothetical protein
MPEEARIAVSVPAEERRPRILKDCSNATHHISSGQLLCTTKVQLPAGGSAEPTSFAPRSVPFRNGFGGKVLKDLVAMMDTFGSAPTSFLCSRMPLAGSGQSHALIGGVRHWLCPRLRSGCRFRCCSLIRIRSGTPGSSLARQLMRRAFRGAEVLGQAGCHLHAPDRPRSC